MNKCNASCNLQFVLFLQHLVVNCINLHQIALVVGSQQVEALNFAVLGLVTWSLLTSLRPVLEPDEEEESVLAHSAAAAMAATAAAALASSRAKRAKH